MSEKLKKKINKFWEFGEVQSWYNNNNNNNNNNLIKDKKKTILGVFV